MDKITSIGNCLEGGNILVTEIGGKEYKYFTGDTVLDIKGLMVNLLFSGWVNVTSLKEV